MRTSVSSCWGRGRLAKLEGEVVLSVAPATGSEVDEVSTELTFGEAVVSSSGGGVVGLTSSLPATTPARREAAGRMSWDRRGVGMIQTTET
jgi:hypothetical protein